MTTPEGRVQAYAQDQLKKRGCLVRKISYEGRRGCPDLLVIAPTGLIVLIELKKSEDKKADPHQEREHARIAKRGAPIKLIGSKRQIDNLIAEIGL